MSCHRLWRVEADPCKRPATDAAPVEASITDEPRSPEEKRRGMTWAQRLKQVFGIDVSTCAHCGGAVRIVARRGARIVFGIFAVP